MELFILLALLGLMIYLFFAHFAQLKKRGQSSSSPEEEPDEEHSDRPE